MRPQHKYDKKLEEKISTSEISLITRMRKVGFVSWSALVITKDSFTLDEDDDDYNYC